MFIYTKYSVKNNWLEHIAHPLDLLYFGQSVSYLAPLEYRAARFAS